MDAGKKRMLEGIGWSCQAWPGNLARGKPGRELGSKSSAHQGQVEQDNPGPGLQGFNLPEGDHCGGSDPEGRVNPEL